MDGATKSVLEAWFDVYQSIVREFKILEKNIYNMDESGFSIGTMESIWIIIDTTFCTKYQVYPGCQEWVSMVECICGDGTAITLFGIFKGKNVLKNWILSKVQDEWFFSANTKGWTSNLHGLEWLKCVFESATCIKADG